MYTKDGGQCVDEAQCVDGAPSPTELLAAMGARPVPVGFIPSHCQSPSLSPSFFSLSLTCEGMREERHTGANLGQWHIRLARGY